jgi:hypothetical protein
LVFLGAYAVFRYFLETQRGDLQRGTVWETGDAGFFSIALVEVLGANGNDVVYALTTSQFISVLVLLATVGLGVLARHRPSALGMNKIDCVSKRELQDELS